MTKVQTYKRVLIKLSGEQFAGTNGTSWIDPEFVTWLAQEVKKAARTSVEIAIVVGGGNIVRGAEFAGHGVERATADYLGMLSTVMNGQVLMDILQNNGQESRIMSSIEMEQIAEHFIRRKAIRHMQKGRVLILTAGSGRPYMTTDTASTTFALELGCDMMFKVTKVDGVYDKDPAKHDDAKKFDEVTFQYALEHPEIGVMDKSALGMAMEQNMPVTIFKLEEDSLMRAVMGEQIGTRIINK